MIYGTGVDIVDITRFERFLAEGNDAIFRRLFSDAEIAYCAGKKRSAQHYALRFAAKEAFLKALGTGLREGLSWKDVEIVNDSLGKPLLELKGMAQEMACNLAIVNIFVSLSHDGDMAIAMVVLER